LPQPAIKVRLPPPDTREADPKAIRDNEDGWNKDFDAKDVAKLTAHYTDDATLIAPGMPAIHNRCAITRC
jgi:ketosteroid isomerase-like protein